MELVIFTSCIYLIVVLLYIVIVIKSVVNIFEDEKKDIFHD
jgi:hypothetical protein